MGIRSRITNSAWWYDAKYVANGEHADPEPPNPRAEQWLATQRELPWYRRSRGWWAEEGAWVALAAVMVCTLLGVAVDAVLSLV
jgi:hypothetical protein